jgi:hypothetical protein
MLNEVQLFKRLLQNLLKKFEINKNNKGLIYYNIMFYIGY